MTVCNEPGCTEHYGCRLRNKGIQASPKVMSSRTLNMKPTPVEPPAFNKQIMYDERPGGYKMPILKPDGHVLRRKEYGEKRRAIESTIRRLRNEPQT